MCFPMTLNWAPTFRQGLVVLMASAKVVLKHETSTPRQSHNFISIDLKFGVGDYVREVTSPAKFGSGHIYGSCDFFCLVEPIFAHSSSKDAFWCKENEK